MNIPYRGWNSFYDGWVARHYSKPDDPSKDESWRRGWQIADGTPTASRIVAFGQEVALGHIVPEDASS